MAYVQTQFENFNDAIILKRFEENETLREKRDIIREEIDNNLPRVFKEHGEECPSYRFLDQGSYQMGTGIKPLSGEYDIDQGLYFSISMDDYPDPVVLKKRVYEALDGHTDKVELRRSCVTVFYTEEQEIKYHVDIAIYSELNEDGKSRHAKGKLHSKPENRIWEVSNLQKLSKTIFGRFSDEEDRKQFRRIVRYLKRWKAVKFTGGGGSAPNGIGLTLLAYYHLQTQYIDKYANKHNDLFALRLMIDRVLNSFTCIDKDGKFGERIEVLLPIEPEKDVFERMTHLHMANFKTELHYLKQILTEADVETDITTACETLQKVFGLDFPVPERQETAKKHPRAIVSSGNSA